MDIFIAHSRCTGLFPSFYKRNSSDKKGNKESYQLRKIEYKKMEHGIISPKEEEEAQQKRKQTVQRQLIYGILIFAGGIILAVATGINLIHLILNQIDQI